MTFFNNRISPHRLFSKLPFWPLSLLITLLAYGLLIPKLGFYWDDWPAAFHIHNNDLSGLAAHFSYDRPFVTWAFAAVIPLAGSSPLAWQLLMLILRWLTSLAAWAALRVLWPSQKQLVAAIALIFLIYPGYDTQPMTISLYPILLSYLLFLVSLAATGMALRNPRHRMVWTLFALVTQAAHMFIIEYIVGLELIRVIYIGLVLSETSAPRSATELIKAVAKTWIPYLALLVVWFAWRFLFLVLPQQPYPLQLLSDIRNDSLSSIFTYGQAALLDILYVLFGTWLGSLEKIQVALNAMNPLWLVITMVAAILVGLFLNGVKIDPKNPQRKFLLTGMILGVLSLIAGLLPIWTIGDTANTSGYGSHYLLAGLLGGSMFTVCLLAFILQSQLARITFIALLVALALNRQVVVADEFSKVWARQQEFFWQLNWRAPMIKTDTAIILFYPISDYMPQTMTSMAINTMYPYSRRERRVDYWGFDISLTRVQKTNQNDKNFEMDYRGL